MSGCTKEPGADSLTGVWQGLYSYADGLSVSFVATLIESGTSLSGATHEPRISGLGPPSTIFATLAGSRDGNAVAFIKTYGREAGAGYGRVDYAGLLNGERTEIEGRWHIPGAGSGKFLMIRSAGKAAAIEQRQSARV
jgi:hypothetical protein